MEAVEIQKEQVRDYYGRVLNSKSDLRSTACCSPDSLAPHVKAILPLIDDEIFDRFYGCGSPLPESLEGCTVLDLGCGTGRDVFIASKLVGPEGKVIGVDMTREQLAVANKYADGICARFGYDEPNVKFVHGFIEDLRTCGIENDSIDVVISNCVINLSPDKSALFAEIFRVLKPGGELFFSDVFCDRRLPSDVPADPVLLGECLGGALYVEDFRRMLLDVGCPDFRVVDTYPVEVTDPELAAKVGEAKFSSLTVRAFKLPDLLEDRCEDFGQVAYYAGSIDTSPNLFILDDHHAFEEGKPMLVCGNTAAMIEETRYGPHFKVVGDRARHYGIFDCAPDGSKPENNSNSCC